MDKVMGWVCVGVGTMALVWGIHALYLLSLIDFTEVMR